MPKRGCHFSGDAVEFPQGGEKSGARGADKARSAELDRKPEPELTDGAALLGGRLSGLMAGQRTRLSPRLATG